MKFRTEYIAENGGITLDPEMPVMLLGSCFADNITRRMRLCLWDAANPFGVLFNPLSIARVMELALHDGDITEDINGSIFASDGYFHSWLFDSKKSADSTDAVCSNIADAVNTFRDKLGKCGAIIITFGTAWCYFLSNRDDYVVANCHKQPQNLFVRRRVNIGSIVDTWQKLIKRIHEKYPELQIIFTVSPVRHLRDGFEGNARSKATLLLAVEEICNSTDHCHYFPAYEIVNDDLRDYRFYAEDLTHPSDTAVEYIWEIFKSHYLDAKGTALLKEGESISRRSRHRNLLNSSEATLKFRRDTAELCRQFADRHPSMLNPENI